MSIPAGCLVAFLAIQLAVLVLAFAWLWAHLQRQINELRKQNDETDGTLDKFLASLIPKEPPEKK